MVKRIEVEEVFDPGFLEALESLRILARRVPARGRFAEHRSKALGTGLEFKDFRPYSPGDDFRAIDWTIYQRLGRVFLRLFEELEDLSLYVMVDSSLSMWQGEPPRMRAALRAALALSAIGLDHHDSVGLISFDEQATMRLLPRSGKGRILRHAKHLCEIEPGGGTDLCTSLRRIGAMALRPGLLIVISDFFDPAGMAAVTAELGRLRHRLLLVQVAEAADRDPQLQGDLRLIDCESALAEDVSVTPTVLERYRAAYDRWQQGLLDLARRRQAGLLRLDVNEALVPQLAQLFRRGVLHV